MIETLFDEIRYNSNQINGWATNTKQFCLASSVVSLRPQISLEIGVFGGKSFFPLACAHRAIGRGIAIGIDPWDDSASVQGQPQEHAQWWGHLDHEPIYDEFLRLVKVFQLTKWIQIHRMTSDLFEPPEGIGVLSVDGNHGPQSIRDVERYAPKVVQGGLVFSDDLTWSGGNVETSIHKLQELGFKELYRVQNKPQGGQDDWACFQKQ